MPNAAVYGKQFVRFAETLTVNAKEAGEFRFVQDINGVTVPLAGIYGTGSTAVPIVAGEIIGVNQYTIPAVADADAVNVPAEPKASRLASVANSGLLLVQCASNHTLVPGEEVKSTTLGLATDQGAINITYAGGKLLAREIITAGPIDYVLISFV